MAGTLGHILNHKQIGVLVGPLRHDLTADDLAKRVYQLFYKVGILCADISRISLNLQVGYAKVEFRTKEIEDFAVQILREIGSVMNVYDMRHLTSKPKYFRVERIVPQDSERKALTGFSKTMVFREHDSHHLMTVYNPLADETSAMLKQTERVVTSLAPGEEQFELISLTGSESSSLSSVELDNMVDSFKCKETITAHVGTSTSEFPTSALRATERSEPIIKLDAKTSTALIDPCFYPGANFYHHLQVLEWFETRYYFDDGKILTYDLRGFRTLIGKLICAFLNTNGGGVYFGVNKRGQVQGVNLNHKYEDALRIDIDSQVKLIEPIVHTSDYYVNFAKVMAKTGYLTVDFKVLEIKVRPLIKRQELYTFKAVPYVWKHNKAVEYQPSKSIQAPSQSSKKSKR